MKSQNLDLRTLHESQEIARPSNKTPVLNHLNKNPLQIKGEPTKILGSDVKEEDEDDNKYSSFESEQHSQIALNH